MGERTFTHMKEGMLLNTCDYPFRRYPRALETNPDFAALSLEACDMLAFIFDRLELSEINSDRFSDENGSVYVIYTVEEVCKKLRCGKSKAIKVLKELETNGMIFRRRTNGSRPSKIYVTQRFREGLKTNPAKSENETLQSLKFEPCKVSKTIPIYNNNNNNNIINNNSSTLVTDEEIKEQIEYDCLYCEEDAGMLNEIVMIISDVLNGMGPTVRVGKDDMPRELVAKRFRMLDGDCVMSVIWQIKRNKTKIYNMKAYLIMLLYNELEISECEAAAFFAMYNA